MPRTFASNHTHTQDTPADTWTIAHGLNCKPVVSVSVNYDGKLQVILPSQIQFVDLNTVVVSFTQPYSGVARLS